MDSSVTSSAAQIIISLIPVVGIGTAGILVFFALLWHHRETKLRIKAGTYTPRKFNLKVFSLLTGLLFIGIGLILIAMFSILEGFSWDLLGGLIPFIIGVMLIIFYKVNPSFKKESVDE